MARFIVSALSEDTIAAPGNRQSNYIVVSVTDLNGMAVTGLGRDNFRVDPIIVGPGGSLVTLETATMSSRLPGFYLLRVVPMSTNTWRAGVYIFCIAVERGSDRGQALASVLMD